jgi:hypothetical protein
MSKEMVFGKPSDNSRQLKKQKILPLVIMNTTVDYRATATAMTLQN